MFRFVLWIKTWLRDWRRKTLARRIARANRVVRKTAPTTTAAMEGVPYLYHYQRFNADWLWETIGNGVVHCPSPADFNDPWDCRPYFNDAFVDDAERRERFIQYIDRADRRHGPTLSEEFRVARLEELRGDRNRLRSLVQELSRIDSAISTDRVPGRGVGARQ